MGFHFLIVRFPFPLVVIMGDSNSFPFPNGRRSPSIPSYITVLTPSLPGLSVMSTKKQSIYMPPRRRRCAGMSLTCRPRRTRKAHCASLVREKTKLIEAQLNDPAFSTTKKQQQVCFPPSSPPSSFVFSRGLIRVPALPKPDFFRCYERHNTDKCISKVEDLLELETENGFWV